MLWCCGDPLAAYHLWSHLGTPSHPPRSGRCQCCATAQSTLAQPAQRAKHSAASLVTRRAGCETGSPPSRGPWHGWKWCRSSKRATVSSLRDSSPNPATHPSPVIAIIKLPTEPCQGNHTIGGAAGIEGLAKAKGGTRQADGIVERLGLGRYCAGCAVECHATQQCGSCVSFACWCACVCVCECLQGVAVFRALVILKVTRVVVIHVAKGASNTRATPP